MARIKDRDAGIFRDGYLTVLDNFTEEEVRRIEELARELNGILDVARKRQQDRLRKAS